MVIKNGLILAGGTGSRLLPTTKIINKHFINIFDKPMIYYSLSILLLLKIKNIKIIIDKETELIAKKLLGNGEEFGVNIDYVLQDKPLGLPHAINSVSKEFSNIDKFIVVLGDNFLHGRDFFNSFYSLIDPDKSNIFFQRVNNPKDFGILSLDKEQKLIDIVEKPQDYISDLAVTGIYTFDNKFFEYFKKTKVSKRNEFEITDILKLYLDSGKLNHTFLGRGMTWMDMGSNESVLSCSNFVKTIQERQNILVNSPHEVAYRNGWIDGSDVEKLIKKNSQSSYFKNLVKNIQSNY
tara:strand:+ start:16400 stop:17281 length:882 start_codon:yes stop_codon:yes gene_type:complete